jgi:hypothetical protein
MDQQSTVMYLSLKGLNAVEIHNDLVDTLKGEAKSYSTVTYYLRKPSFSSPRHPSLLRVQLQFSTNRRIHGFWQLSDAEQSACPDRENLMSLSCVRRFEWREGTSGGRHRDGEILARFCEAISQFARDRQPFEQ